jgi:hypothetical protein
MLLVVHAASLLHQIAIRWTGLFKKAGSNLRENLEQSPGIQRADLLHLGRSPKHPLYNVMPVISAFSGDAL